MGGKKIFNKISKSLCFGLAILIIAYAVATPLSSTWYSAYAEQPRNVDRSKIDLVNAPINSKTTQLSVSGGPNTNAMPSNFTGTFAVPGNWILTNTNVGGFGNPPSGTVNTAAAPVSITLVGSDTNNPPPSACLGGNPVNQCEGKTDYKITMPASCTLEFDWSYSTADSAGSTFDVAYYSINGIGYALPPNPSDSSSVEIKGGDVFGFGIDTLDGRGGAASLTISKFDKLGACDIPSTLSPVSIASNNANATTAKVGDVVTVSFTSDGPITTPTVTISGSAASVSGGPTMWTATHTVTNTDPEGSVTFSISSYKSTVSGKDGPTVTTVTDGSSVLFDKTAPTVAITSSIPVTGFNTSTPSFSGTATDTGAGVARVTWKVDSGLVSTASGTTSWSFTTSSISDGLHTIQVNATDHAGNVATISNGFLIPLRPSIVYIIGAGSGGYVSGATITVKFDQATSQPFIVSTGNNYLKADVDSLFKFLDGSNNPLSIGTGYTGKWYDKSTFIITITDPTGVSVSASELIGILKIQVQVGAHLKNAPLTSPDSTAISLPLTGDFGRPAPPIISALVVADPDGGSTDFHAGDVFTVKFDKSTNKAGGTVNVNNLFTFSPSLGSATFSGQWTSSDVFKITVNTVDSGNPAQIGTTTVQVKSTAGLKNSAEDSPASTSTSPPLTGTFGAFTIETPLAAGGSSVITLPSGITAIVQLPPGQSGNVTTNSTTGTGSFTFLDKPVDLSLSGGVCTPICTFSFQFTDNDLAAAGLSLADVVIWHDRNHNSIFEEGTTPSEKLATTITPSSPPGYYTATATDDVTSKFAIGGIIPALAILGVGHGGTSSYPQYSSVSFAPTSSGPGDNGIFSGVLINSDHPTNTIEAGTPFVIQMDISSLHGPQTIQHVALYTNLNGQDRNIQNSDTSVIYEPGKPLEISNQEGLISNANVITSINDHYLHVVFNMTFAKPMAKSDIILRSWDNALAQSDDRLHDAIIVTEPQAAPQNTGPELQPTTQTPTGEIQIPSWVKNNAGWWSKGEIGDSEFVQGIQFLIQQGMMKIPETQSGSTTTQFIPSWVKNNAGWWSSGEIGDSEFVQGIQYLVQQGIMKINN